MKNFIYNLKPNPRKLILTALFAWCLFWQQNGLSAQCSPDTTPPVAVCELGLVAKLNSSGELTVWAQDFDDGSYDLCSDISYTIEEGLPPSSTPPTAQSLSYDSDDIGLHDIVLWVVDTAGNWNTCGGLRPAGPWSCTAARRRRPPGAPLPAGHARIAARRP